MSVVKEEFGFEEGDKPAKVSDFSDFKDAVLGNSADLSEAIVNAFYTAANSCVSTVCEEGENPLMDAFKAVSRKAPVEAN